MFAVPASNRWPAWVAFIGTLTLMMTLRLASRQALINGFSNVSVLTVVAARSFLRDLYLMFSTNQLTSVQLCHSARSELACVLENPGFFPRTATIVGIANTMTVEIF